MLGILAGRIAKLGMLQASASAAAMPMRPLEPGRKPTRSASAIPMGIITTARPTDDGITKPSKLAATVRPITMRA